LPTLEVHPNKKISGVEIQGGLRLTRFIPEIQGLKNAPLNEVTMPQFA